MNTSELQLPAKAPRTFLPSDFIIDKWETVKPYYESLLNRTVDSVESLQSWLRDRSELESVLQEDVGWRYIRMSCNTADQKLTDAFNFFIAEIEPHMAPYDDKLNRKLIDSAHVKSLDGSDYDNYLKKVRTAIELFREENIPLYTKLQSEEQKYAAITGAMMVEIEGKELTLVQASNILKSIDRSKRQEAYDKITNRREQDSKQLDELFNQLIKLRHQIARNAGFDNFRDFSFKSMCRFDYTPQDCFDFQDAIAEQIVPVDDEINRNRKKALALDKLKPWDLDVDPDGKPPLKPFTDGDDLMSRSMSCFYEIDKYFGECLETLRAMNHVDLESRKGKAPGGYNYPLYEVGVPFVFMNSAGSLRDVITMVHEGGHAIHSMLTRDLEFISFKDVPSEVAELASMSMELISMEHWSHFFDNDEDLRRAKKYQLEKVLSVLPWIATIDKFQHWIYTNPDHTVTQRDVAWKKIHTQFIGNVIDFDGQETQFLHTWQKQLHLYQVPFYYIEYGMAQLGAIAMWKSYKNDSEKTIVNYKKALSLGYTKSIGDVYASAGIRFDFSSDYIRELADFVRDELNLLN